MNFLAHIYLSGNNNGLKIGNFIGDFVKGKDYEFYPENIKQGILLHRFIDSYTDNHRMVYATQAVFKPLYRRYAGVVTDVIFDYYLANNWNTYSGISLQKFCFDFYWQLLTNFFLLPYRVKRFTPHLIASNRLESYKTLKGIQKALAIMAKYTSLPGFDAQAIEIIKKNNTEIEYLFNTFMPQIIETVQDYKNKYGLHE